MKIMAFYQYNRQAFLSGGMVAIFVLGIGIGIWLVDEFSQPIFSAGFFRIRQGDTLRDVSLELSRQGFIDNPLLLLWYGEVTGRDKKIKSGFYDIPGGLRVRDLLVLFEKGSNVRIKLFLPEGLTLDQSVERMRQGGLNIDDKFFLNPPEELRDKYWFLRLTPQGKSLEGFLFPDTYTFLPENETEKIAKALLDNFESKFKSEWYKHLDLEGRSFYDTLTIASILEKEVPLLKDKKIISGILWKRLSLGIPLQVDATVNYATGKNLPAVTLGDLAIDSPYNTYKYQGLPPGPIANPGEESLEAAVFPEPSDYWFYLSRQDTGETIFSKTFKEHIRAKARYLR